MLCVDLDVSRDNSRDTPLQNDFLCSSFLQILTKEINLTSHVSVSVFRQCLRTFLFLSLYMALFI